MGDRTNPIKFGPEWLRNLARERSIRASPGAQSGGAGGAAAPPGMGGLPAAHRPPAANPTTNLPKVLLARQRYGREEMLALYDRQTAEAPAQLKSNDILYVPRGQPPYALNNSFEDETRDNMARQPPPGGLLATNDRYAGAGRGRGMGLGDPKTRGIPLGDIKGKSRGFNRPTSAGRGWHGNQRSGYSGIPDDDPNQSLRPWSNNNHQNSGLRPNNGEQPDWQTKQQQYRMKRQTSTNWRQQQGRDEGEEWRSSDAARRPQDKWAEWGWQQEPNNRPNQEKWHNNRRTWMGGEGNEDALPEWAVDNAEACGGTFDSSGAFHGYSNDDSNIPKNQETPYPLTKSHTHGSLVRTKMAEEGSEEWWASEKAKKLSPKRFDANELQFKKSLSMSNADEKSNLNSTTTKTSGANDSHTQSTGAIPKRSYQKSVSCDKTVKDKSAQPSANKEEDENSSGNNVSAPATSDPEEYNQNKTEDNTKEKIFDQRSNSEKQNEKGNFQSVILTSNNTLRQKHQNIVITPTETPKRQPKLMHYMETTNQPRQLASEAGGYNNRKETESNKIVEDILQMSLDDGIPSATINQMLTSHSNSSMDSSAQVPFPSMQMRMASTLQGLNPPPKPNAPHSAGMQAPEAYNGMMQQPIGMTNSMLNASLGLPMPNSNSGMPQGIPPSLSNTGLPNPNALASGLQVMGGANLQQPGLQQGNMQVAGLQTGQVTGLQGLQMQGLQGFAMQSAGALQNQLGSMPNSGLQTGGPGLQSATSPMSGMPNNSLFNNQMQHVNDMTNFSNSVGDPVAALHRLQQLASQRMNNAMYNNMMSQPPPPIAMQQMISDQWYYEDPNNTIQGPFSSKEMFNWFRAGFFSPTLMVRRECEAVMRPLGTYGPMPFGPMDLLPPFPMGGGFDLRPQQSHDNMMNPQPSLGINDLTSKGHQSRPSRQPPHIATNVRYNLRNQAHISNQAQIKVTVKSAGSIRARPDSQTPAPQSLFQLVQNNKVQSLWGQPASNAANPDHMWMQAMNNNSRNENPINNLPMYFWDNQPAEMPAAPLLPETIKTEEEILAQMRGTQAQGPTSPLSFFAESPVAPPEVDATIANAALNVNQLQKLIQKDTVTPAATESVESEQQVPEKPASGEEYSSEVAAPKVNKVADKTVDAKPTKEVIKVDSKSKSKEAAKPKSKKVKEEKKEETVEIKTKEEEVKVEQKRSAEPSPSPKNKKEDKSSKKDLDKEKKEWIKEGFTIVKGVEKSKDKDTKKKAEEIKAVEEAERKRKEEEKLAAEDKKRQIETSKKQQDAIQAALPSRQAVESVLKKAPWSASSQGLQASSRDGPTLAEIQRLEREKKLEQMKEQQHMMQLIAQQQAAALAREQEVQTTLGWAKKPSSHSMHQTLAEIQAEARMQSSSAAAAAAPREEAQPTPPPVAAVPWANVHNGGAGFWDTPQMEPLRPVAKPAEPKAELKSKKKVTVMAPPKPENTPSVEFDMWCTNMLVSWRDTGIDVPTFVSFLRDIESPYEVKDYVKCYLGDSRDANDFARQFLEKRSRLMRVGMVTPSDDLCSPAMAVNPRTISGSDHAELKAKGKKTKKNKMLKVDARNILGFSVTASEDRINVGDIDTV